MTEKKTLNLVLKRQWYNMIESGEKSEEYREIKPHWIKRICPTFDDPIEVNHCEASDCKYCKESFSKYQLVRFYLGYTNVTMTFEVESIRIGVGNPAWGAPEEPVFIIKLGNRVE